MGRQHTTWISEDNWRKLENIPGKSTSAKIGWAIHHGDPDKAMWMNAKLRQLETAKSALRLIASTIEDHHSAESKDQATILQLVDNVLDQHDWLWEASA